MNGREKIYFLLDAIVDRRELTPKGQPIFLHPANDLNKHYSDTELSQIYTKLEKDERIIRVLKTPTGDPLNLDPYAEFEDGYYYIELLPAFENYYFKIQNETEYQEFTGKKPTALIRTKLSRKSLEKIWTVLQEIEDKRGITPAQDDISIPFVHLSKVRDDVGAINASDERRNILRKLENEERAIKDVRFPDNLHEYVYLKIEERYFEVFDYYEKMYKEAARNYQQEQQIPKPADSLKEQYNQLLREIKEPSNPTLTERYNESLKDTQLNQHPTEPQIVPNTNDSNSFSLTENVLSVNERQIRFNKDARTLALLKLLMKKTKGIYYSELLTMSMTGFISHSEIR